MLLMKKDMGGAAHVLALARYLIETKAPVRLRVLVPAVENAVSGQAFRPGDVLSTRAGKTVEVGNTDAEGRLVLADALTLACEESPALVVDFATLTGAARVAVGTEVAAYFTREDLLSVDLERCSQSEQDPCWRLPLYASYRRLLDSSIADLSNMGSSPFGGAITAGLFLGEFVPEAVPWVHFDIMAWNLAGRKGFAEGGEMMGMRAMAKMIEEGSWSHG
mgnify:CR=1 FL=1